MSGFRESAKPTVVADDPHGARAAAFALPERLRDAIDRPHWIEPPKPQHALLAVVSLCAGVLFALGLGSAFGSPLPLLLVLPGLIAFWGV